MLDEAGQHDLGGIPCRGLLQLRGNPFPGRADQHEDFPFVLLAADVPQQGLTAPRIVAQIATVAGHQLGQLVTGDIAHRSHPA